MRGKVTVVRELPLGTELAADAPAGSLSLLVEDVEAMEPQGGQLLLGLEGKTYTLDETPTEDSDELDLDDEPDAEQGTLTLATPLASDHFTDDRVLIFPKVYERWAWVDVEGQPEDLKCRISDELLNADKLPTGSRDASTSETVQIRHEEDEWIVSDLIGEQAAGRTRAYAEGSIALVTGTPADPDVVCQLAVDIPTEQHRVIWWASGYLSADDGVEVELAFDDDGIDFPVGSFPLVKFTGDPGFNGPSFIAPALPLINLPPGVPVTLPNGLTTGGVSSKYLPTSIMPYNADPPTPGLHFFRLVAYVLSGAGDASVDDARFWATVI